MSGNATHSSSRRRPSRVPPLKPLTLTMQQASAVTGLGLSKLYQKIRDGTLRTIMVDGRRLVFYSSLEAMLPDDAATS